MCYYCTLSSEFYTMRCIIDIEFIRQNVEKHSNLDGTLRKRDKDCKRKI